MSIELSQTTSINDLMNQYNDVKSSSTDKAKSLVDNFTLKGMDSVNELVSDAMKQIDKFTANGQQSSFFKKSASKALTLVGGENSWLGKWADRKSDDLQTEKLNEMTINEIVDSLIANINSKREEVIVFIENALEVKKDMLANLGTYQGLQTQVQALVATAEPHSRELFNGKQLSMMLSATIDGIESAIKSQIDPLITASSASVEKISALLPTIENELKYTTGFKAFEQKLSDLNGMVTAVTQMTSSAGDIIRKDVNEAVYKAVELMGETGIDMDRWKRIQKEEAAHLTRVNSVVKSTQAKFDRTYEEVQQFQLESKQAREDTTNLLIESYATISKE